MMFDETIVLHRHWWDPLTHCTLCGRRVSAGSWEGAWSLQEGTHTLTEIAFLVGYSDAAHFTRAFRRWTGSPPRDYVRGLRLSREFNAAKPRSDVLQGLPFLLTAFPGK